MKKIFFFALFLNFSCNFSDMSLPSQEDRESLIRQASLLQDQADCVELSQQKRGFIMDLKRAAFGIEEEMLYLRKNFDIIEGFIEQESDPIKKSKAQRVYEKLLFYVFEKGVFISIEDSPSVFKAFFQEFPVLREELFRESEKSLAFYNLYDDLDATLSTGVNYDKIFFIVDENIEKIGFQEEETAIEFQDFIFGSLYNLIKHDCFCSMGAAEFASESICSEIIFNK